MPAVATLSLQGAVGQSANLVEVKNSTGTILSQVDLSGNLTATSLVKTGGTSTQYLMADGSVTTGSVPASSDSTLAMIPTYYYRTPTTNTLSSATYTIGTTFFTPIFIPVSGSYDRIAMRSGSTFAGTGTVRLGIYDNTSDRPSTVELDAGTVSVTAANTNYEITISKTLNVGWYWLALNCQVAGTTNAIGSFANSAAAINPLMGTATPTGNFTVGFTETATVTSGFATAGTLTPRTDPAVVWLRKA